MWSSTHYTDIPRHHCYMMTAFLIEQQDRGNVKDIYKESSPQREDYVRFVYVTRSKVVEAMITGAVCMLDFIE